MRTVRALAAGLLLVNLVVACGSEPEAPAPDSPPVRLLGELERLRAEGRYAEGIARARGYLDRHPVDPRVAYALGVLLGSDDDHQAAIEAFRRSLDRDPKHYGSRLGLGISQARLGRHEAALIELRRCLDVRTDDATAMFELGRSLSALGQLDEARSWLERVNTLQPGPQARVELGMLHRRAGRPRLAEEAFRAALAEQGDHLPAMHALGQVLLTLGREAEGLALLERHEELATLQDRLDTLERGSRLHGATAANFISLGEVQTGLGKTDEALASYHRAIELDPESARAALGLASLYHRRGAFGDATKWCVYALANDPDNWKTYLLLGVLRLRRGEIEAAEEAFETSRSLGDWTARTYRHQAEGYAAADQTHRAVQALLASIELADDDGRAHYLLARLRYVDGIEDLESARRATELDPSLADAWILQGIIRHRRGELEQARRAFRRAHAELAGDTTSGQIAERFAGLPDAAPSLALYRLSIGDAG